MAEGTFGERLADAVTRCGPLCVGIDPSADLLARWGLPDDGAGLAAFGVRCVEALAGVVGVVKPQVAFFERHGSSGIAALEVTLAAAREAGMVTLADAKRGDVDSTMAAYAEAWLSDDSPLAADAVTAHPYLGLGALAPMVTLAQTTGRAVLVVVRSSNPEGRPLQQAVTADGALVEDDLLTRIAALNDGELAGAEPGRPLGAVGAVIGATLEPGRFDLAGLRGPVLAPGLGAQGASPADVVRRFARCPEGTLVASASRSVLSHGPDPGALADAASVLQGEFAGSRV
jgi:orotidine-5'-phosphate decarboxylase